MTSRDQLLEAIGSTLSVLGAGGALALALRTLRDVCAEVLVELETKNAKEADQTLLRKNCDSGHTWIMSFGVNKTTGHITQRRSCAVCRLADEVEAVPPTYRRG